MTKNKGFVHTNNKGRVLACQTPDACPFGTAATTAEESQALYVKKVSELLSSSSIIHRYRKNQEQEIRDLQRTSVCRSEGYDCF